MNNFVAKYQRLMPTTSSFHILQLGPLAFWTVNEDFLLDLIFVRVNSFLPTERVYLVAKFKNQSLLKRLRIKDAYLKLTAPIYR